MPQQDKNSHPRTLAESPIDNVDNAVRQPETPMQITPDDAAHDAAKEAARQKSRWRAFWDFFVLFSGVSTRSNLSRTRPDPIQSRGLFLFRSRKR